MSVGLRVAELPATALDSATTRPARMAFSESSHSAHAAVAGYALITGTPSPSDTVQNPQQCFSSQMRFFR